MINNKNYADAIKYALIGIQLDPTRAELYCFIGDIYCVTGELPKAIPNYMAAIGCQNKGNGLTHEFTFKECYDYHPKINLAKIYYNLGDFDTSYHFARELNTDESREIIDRIMAARSNMDYSKAIECDDIVITCPMQKAYDWDEEVYKTKGLGGSETAAVEMAKHLKAITGRSVKIFQERESTLLLKAELNIFPSSSSYLL